MREEGEAKQSEVMRTVWINQFRRGPVAHYLTQPHAVSMHWQRINCKQSCYLRAKAALPLKFFCMQGKDDLEYCTFVEVPPLSILGLEKPDSKIV